jgi:hypothetical protein
MTKQQFLEKMEVLQGQGFEVFKAMFNELEFEKEKSEKISIGSDLFKEITEQVAEEISGDATGLIGDYELEMYSNEVTLSDLTLSERGVRQIVVDVLERYFEVKS